MNEAREDAQFLGVARLWWSARYSVGVATVCFAAIAAVHSLLVDPVFQSLSVLAPARGDESQTSALASLAGQFSGAAGMLGISGLAEADVEETLAILRSREFARHFIIRNDLLPYLFPAEWDSIGRKWKGGANSSEGGVDGWLGQLPDDRRGAPQFYLAFEIFDEMREVVVDRRTGFITLKMKGPTPQLSSQWAAALIAQINQDMRERAIAESLRNIEALKSQLEQEELEVVKSALASILEAQIKRKVLAETKQDFALVVLDPPNLPEERFSPKRKRNVLVGAVAGLLLSLIWLAFYPAFRAIFLDLRKAG